MPHSFLSARNSMLSVLSKGCMLSFFLWKRTEFGFVRPWIVLSKVLSGKGHFVPWRRRVRLGGSMS